MKTIHRKKWFFISNIVLVIGIVMLIGRLIWENNINIISEESSVSISTKNSNELQIIFIWKNDESLWDDSISPYFQNIIALKRNVEGKREVINQINLWKCQEGRWHQDFSDESCI